MSTIPPDYGILPLSEPRPGITLGLPVLGAGQGNPAPNLSLASFDQLSDRSSLLYRAGATPSWLTLIGSFTLPYLLTTASVKNRLPKLSSFLLDSRAGGVVGAVAGGLLFSLGYALFLNSKSDKENGGVEQLAFKLILPLSLGFCLSGSTGFLRTRPTEYFGFLDQASQMIFKNDWRGFSNQAGLLLNPGWYWKPFVGSGEGKKVATGLSRLYLSSVRIGGVTGLGINLYHKYAASDELKKNVMWQKARMAFGGLMLLGTVEYAVSTMALLRYGTLISALTEFVVEYANQRKTTDVVDLDYLRFAVGIIRTGIFSLALDRGIYFTRLRRLAKLDKEQFLARYSPEKFSGRLKEMHREMSALYDGGLSESTKLARLHDALGGLGKPLNLRGRLRNLREFAKAESRGQRISVALEGVIPTSLLMAPVYTAEGWMQNVNPKNYFYARAQQTISPSPLMQIAGEYLGDYTRVRSIFVNKFLLFWILGNGTYVLYPKYAGEAKSVKTLSDTISSATREDPERGKMWREKVSFYARKKLGHVDGDLISFDGWFGYMRASKYSLSNDAQPFGVFFGTIMEKTGDLLGMSWLIGLAKSMYQWADTLFTPNHSIYYTLFDAIRSPDQYGLNEEKRDALVESLDHLVKTSPLLNHEEAKRLWQSNRNEYLEEWALLRSLAVFCVLSDNYPAFKRLQENEVLQKLRHEMEEQYLKGTNDLLLPDQLKEALRRLSRDTIRRRYGYS